MRFISVFFAMCLIGSAMANTLYPLANPEQEVRFNSLLKNYRCLVCQNQDLADSNAPLAKDLRLQVYHLVKQGKTESEINEYLTSRFGDFILFKPPFNMATLFLWSGPFLFLLLGFIFWIRIHR